jgi:hypothetical protein
VIQRYLAKQRLPTEDAPKSNGAVASDHGPPPSTVPQSNRLTTHESRRDQSPGADSSKVAPKASKKKTSAENLEPSPRKVEYSRSIKKTHQAGPTDPSSDYEEPEDAHHSQNQPHCEYNDQFHGFQGDLHAPVDEVVNHKHDSNASPHLPSNREKSHSTSQFAESTPLVWGTKTHHRPSRDSPSLEREALKAATSRLESDIPADSEDIASPHTQFSSKYHNAASGHRPLKRSLEHDEESMPTRNHSSPSNPIATRPNSMQPQKVRKLVHGPFGRATFETKVPVNDEDSDSSRGPARPKDLIGLGSDGAHDGLQNGTPERLHNEVGVDGEATKPHLPLEEGDTLSLTQLENDNQGFGRHGQTAREELDLLLPFIRRQQGNTLPPTFPAPLDPAQHSSEERTSSTTIRKPTLTRGLTPSTLQRTRSTPDLEKKLSRPPERKKSRPSFFGEADRSVQRGSSSTSISINGGRFSSPQTPLSASLPPSPSVIDSDERATLAFQVTQKLFDRFSKEYGWTHSVIEDVFREVNFDPMDARELLDGMHQACLRFKREWDTKRSNAFEDAGGSDFGNNWARRDQ